MLRRVGSSWLTQCRAPKSGGRLECHPKPTLVRAGMARNTFACWGYKKGTFYFFKKSSTRRPSSSAEKVECPLFEVSPGKRRVRIGNAVWPPSMRGRGQRVPYKQEECSKVRCWR